MARTILNWDGGVIEFDAVEVEAPEHDCVITSYPVELGANLVDHIRVQPITMRLTCVVTNSPARADGWDGGTLGHLDDAQPSRGVDIRVRESIFESGAAPSLPNSIASIPLMRIATVRAAVRVWGDGTTRLRRVQNVLAELLQAQREARIFDVVTDVSAEYSDMLIKSVRFERTAEWANALRIEIELFQLLRAEVSKLDVSHLIPQKPRTKPPKAAQKPAEEVDAKTEEAADGNGNSWVLEALIP